MHDRRHALLRNYISNNVGNQRDIAQAIRPSLESYFRVACPEYFPPGTLLGQFRDLCTRQLGTNQEILNCQKISELRNIIEYSNRFHHDTNPAWETAIINDGELSGFVQRTINFIHPN
jgi:hypothetical protein